MSIAANLVSRGAVAVYGLTSSLYLFTRVQHHKAVTQDIQTKFLAEEGKVTDLTHELNKTKEQLKQQMDIMYATPSLWPAAAAEPAEPKSQPCECDASSSMLMGTIIGGFIAVIAGLGK
jgi:hypothetical protein